ncbi:MAG: geranylgeranylglyceryl/heptaprenylglyceryl phosphate synthase [Candidatus Zixiibacteriota bacterium]
MPDGSIYTRLTKASEERGGGFLLLIDPDRKSPSEFLPLVEAAESCGVDGMLVGTSFSVHSNFDREIAQMKSRTTLPVVIFPGSYAQLSPEADAVLFMSLISGRNPAYLIEEQVKGAPLVRKYGLEAIPTGYMLVESGPLTSVQYISGTMPIPRSKGDIAAAHALAAECLGMKMIYLEAGSGAQMPVPPEMVKEVAGTVRLPVTVGGGLRTPEDCVERIEAGASFVVVGSELERDDPFGRLREMTDAAHRRGVVKT